MKGINSDDGKISGNVQLVNSHNKAHKKPPAEPMGGMGEGGGENPEQIAQEHGPAHHVSIEHDHEGGEHHVHSHHPSGHHHHSTHGSVDEAHAHAHKLAGGGGQPMAQGMGEPDADDQVAQSGY